jgi:hypothetical protein
VTCEIIESERFCACGVSNSFLVCFKTRGKQVSGGAIPEIK